MNIIIRGIFAKICFVETLVSACCTSLNYDWSYSKNKQSETGTPLHVLLRS